MITIFGILWWVLLIDIFFAIGVIAAIERNIFLPAVALAFFAFIFTQYVAGYDLISFVMNDPGTSILYLLGYFVVGFFWSVVRWVLFVNSSEQKAKIKIAHKNWQKDSSTKEFEESRYYPYSFRNDFERILGWVVFWPFSVISSFFGDFLNNIFRFIGRGFSGFFWSIAKNATKKVIGE